MRFLLAIAATTSAVLMMAPTASPTSPTQAVRRTTLEAAILREVNRVRVARGLNSLSPSPSLHSAATGHSRAMLELGFFGHESADGTAFSDRIRRHYASRGWRMWSVGEALLATHAGETMDPVAIVQAWLDSPPHREIVLSSAWRDSGIGVLYAPTAPREFRDSATLVVTADFGLRKGRVTPS